MCYNNKSVHKRSELNNLSNKIHAYCRKRVSNSSVPFRLIFYNYPATNFGMGFFARLDKKDAGNKLGFYKLLQLLIEEHGAMEALINLMLSGNTVAVELRWINRVYAEKQRLVIRYTGDCTSVIAI
ncbi:hypothetical protein Tsp_00849 [Trichinella spiralis]|uniref:hypothetical protein n=1 Tax=Trichinella spiralis TaxID=6334 RepID=UPI0001EFB2A4|nr:hypothetical protein Tsp_00849 [Trichinella spiralis]